MNTVPKKRKRKRKHKLLKVFFLCFLIIISFFIIKSALKEIDTKDYVLIEKSYGNIYIGNLILVNNTVQFHFENGNEPISVFDNKSSSYKVKDKSILVNESITDPLNNMMDDYQAKTGDSNVIIVSGHRTFDNQKILLKNNISEFGEKEARRLVALPGGSEHHTGLAIDFSVYSDSGNSNDFNGKGNQKWIIENAYKYGFIIRYKEEGRASL